MGSPASRKDCLAGRGVGTGWQLNGEAIRIMVKARNDVVASDGGQRGGNSRDV